MLKRGLVQIAYLMSWLVFAAGALALNSVCLVLLLFSRPRERFGGWVRAAIRRLFQVWTAWLEFAGLVAFEWDAPPGRLARPAIYVANHPSLLDATFLLSRLPDAITIFKARLLDNPLLGPAARLAGYAPGNAGVDLIRRLADEAAGGRTVLIFPEGTRTAPAADCNELKPGFALIARRARLPVEVLVIRANRDLLPRGGAWWRAPRAPSLYRVQAAGTVAVSPERAIADIVAEVRERFIAGVRRQT
ncbi:MAG: lysophospholipid acyltransferase family protein [Opitutaceae bacterium]